MVKVILQSGKFSPLFLIQCATTTGEETFRESTHNFSFLDGLERKPGKEARVGELNESKSQGHESLPAKKPKIRAYMLPGANSR